MLRGRVRRGRAGQQEASAGAGKVGGAQHRGGAPASRKRAQALARSAARSTAASSRVRLEARGAITRSNKCGRTSQRPPASPMRERTRAQRQVELPSDSDRLRRI